MPVDSSKVIQSIRRKAGLESYVTPSTFEHQDPLIQMEIEEEANHEPLIESAGETYGRPISVCFAGVGTCGVNILMSLKAQNSSNNLVDFVGINSDGGSIKELEKNGFKNNIALSGGDAAYLGAGGDLDAAKKLGESYYDKFKKRFRNVDLVLVVTGMGGGTGTGVAPLVAKAAKEVQNNKRNSLTIGVATMPAGIESDRREIAVQGIEELKKYVDALVVIDQMNLLDVLDQENASMDEADELIDSRFEIVLQSIMDTITNYTKRNIDFADICSTLKDSGDSIITTVEASAGNVEDIKKELAKAVNDKLLVNHSNKIASRLMIYQFYEQGYSERSHYEVVSEVQRLFNWTKSDNGYYSCVLEQPPEGTRKFLKIGNGSGEEYKGKTKVIVIAGGFVNKISGKTAKAEIPILKPRTEPLRQVESIRQSEKLDPLLEKLISQPQPQLQPQQQPQETPTSSLEQLLKEFSL
jgi:cell division protein FtsZ